MTTPSLSLSTKSWTAYVESAPNFTVPPGGSAAVSGKLSVENGAITWSLCEGSGGSGSGAGTSISIALASISRRQVAKANPKLQVVTSSGNFVFRFTDLLARDEFVVLISAHDGGGGGGGGEGDAAVSTDASSGLLVAREIARNTPAMKRGVVLGGAVAGGVIPKITHTTTYNPLADQDVDALKMDVLRYRSDILLRYKELVRGTNAVLSEFDFWAAAGSRAALVDAAARRARPGVAGGTPSLEACVTVIPGQNGTSDSQQLRITDAVKVHVFSREPAVYAFFQTAVPLKLTEPVFWESLLQAARRRKAGAAALVGAAVARAAEDNRKKRAAVDPGTLAPRDFFDLYSRGIFDEDVPVAPSVSTSVLGQRGGSKNVDLAATENDHGGVGGATQPIGDGDLVSHFLATAAMQRVPPRSAAQRAAAKLGAAVGAGADAGAQADAAERARIKENEADSIIAEHNAHARSVISGGNIVTTNTVSFNVPSAADDLPDLRAAPVVPIEPFAPLHVDQTRLRARLQAAEDHQQQRMDDASLSNDSAIVAKVSITTDAGGGGGGGGWGIIEVGAEGCSGEVLDDDEAKKQHPSSSTLIASVGEKRRRRDNEGDDDVEEDALHQLPPPPPPPPRPLNPASALRASGAAATTLFSVMRQSTDLWARAKRSADGFSELVPRAWAVYIKHRAGLNDELMRHAWAALAAMPPIGVGVGGGGGGGGGISAAGKRAANISSALAKEARDLAALRSTVQIKGVENVNPPGYGLGGVQRDPDIIQILDAADADAAKGEVARLLYMLEGYMARTRDAVDAVIPP